MARRLCRMLPNHPRRHHNPPSTHALSETAGTFCESSPRWSEVCPARLRRDFAAQRTSAELHGLGRRDLQSADNDVRIRTAAFPARSRSNDDLCTYPEAHASTRRDFGAQQAQALLPRLAETQSYRRAKFKIERGTPTSVCVPRLLRPQRFPLSARHRECVGRAAETETQ